jgi:alkylation response protein AidB-like acyl-CoA dehydrogenase
MIELQSPSKAPHRALARYLAGPECREYAFDPARLAVWDREEAFPADACHALDRFGLPGHYVPKEYGGRLSALDELMQSWRAVARHDLTVAIGHGKTFLGCVCVWLAGSREQRLDTAREVLTGTVFSWGLTERDHGSDLLAGELTAERVPGGWRIDGEKWLINNATRGQAICILARTGNPGDSRGFSLFMVDKRRLPPESVRYLPKVRTHGIRGADISGIAFHDARLPDDALIGMPGAGIEIVLKALQLTRSACVGLSLGAADHAFRLTMEFMDDRRLYGRKLIDLPMARRILGEAAAMHFAAETVALAVTRAMHGLPQEMSVMSAIAKAFVPATVERLIGKLGELLGARAYLDHVHGHGLFQKLERDHRIVPIFDGSTVVNRHGVINQFPMLVRAWQRGECDMAGIKNTFAWPSAPAALAVEKLRLIASQGCSIVQSLTAAVEMLVASAEKRDVPCELAAITVKFKALADAVLTQMAAFRPTARAVPADAFELARRYELCFAGAACLQFWLQNDASANIAAERTVTGLHAVLTWLVDELEPHGAADHHHMYDRLAAYVIDDPQSRSQDGLTLWTMRSDQGAGE